jgi:hypothetical protein
MAQYQYLYHYQFYGKKRAQHFSRTIKWRNVDDGSVDLFTAQLHAAFTHTVHRTRIIGDS